MYFLLCITHYTLNKLWFRYIQSQELNKIHCDIKELNEKDNYDVMT